MPLSKQGVDNLLREEVKAELLLSEKKPLKSKKPGKRQSDGKQEQRPPLLAAGDAALRDALLQDVNPVFNPQAVHRITESQNSRGWKGPLWVI